MRTSIVVLPALVLVLSGCGGIRCYSDLAIYEQPGTCRAAELVTGTRSAAIRGCDPVKNPGCKRPAK